MLYPENIIYITMTSLLNKWKSEHDKLIKKSLVKVIVCSLKLWGCCRKWLNSANYHRPWLLVTSGLTYFPLNRSLNQSRDCLTLAQSVSWLSHVTTTLAPEGNFSQFPGQCYCSQKEVPTVGELSWSEQFSCGGQIGAPVIKNGSLLETPSFATCLQVWKAWPGFWKLVSHKSGNANLVLPLLTLSIFA